jgi:hypothetical protein
VLTTRGRGWSEAQSATVSSKNGSVNRRLPKSPQSIEGVGSVRLSATGVHEESSAAGMVAMHSRKK